MLKNIVGCLILTLTITGCNVDGFLDESPPILAFVESSNLSSTSVTITFTTNKKATATVEYADSSYFDENSSYNQTEQQTTFANSHSITLNNLSPSTTYHYQVVAVDSGDRETSSSDHTFTTLATNTDAPVLSNPTPPLSSTLQAGTTSAILGIGTNKDTTCRYSTIANTAYDLMSDNFAVTGTTTHTTVVSGLSDGNSYSYYIRCRDNLGNTNDSDYPITFSIAESGSSSNHPPVLSPIADISVTEGDSVVFSPSATDEDGDSLIFSYTGWMTTSSYETVVGDEGTHRVLVTVEDGNGGMDSQDVGVTVIAASSDTTPPALSAGAPTGELPAGTLSATLSLATDENADCRYATAAGIDYGNMANTFSTTGGPAHTTTVNGLSDANTYSYYVRCRDLHGNANETDYLITFTVASLGAVDADHVDLTLDAPYTVQDAPVRTGIPFPVGALSSINNLRLENGSGTQELPAQFDTLASWPDGSVKSALVQFVTDIDAAPRDYRVAYGTSIVRNDFGRSIEVIQGTDTTVDTGAIKLAINDKGLISSLWQDSNNDSQYSSSEQVIDGSELFLVNAKNSLEYLASQATDSQVVVEENGPVRAVIKVTGSMTNSNGGQLTKYLVRYYAHLDSDKLDIEFTLIDDRLEENVHSAESYRNPTELALAISSYGMRMHYVSSDSPQYRFGGENGAVYNGTITGEHYLLQRGAFTYDNGEDQGHSFNYSGAGTGNRAPGWMALDDGNRHMAIMVKDFWQQFPNELSIDTQNLTVSLHPERALGGPPEIAPVTQGLGGTQIYRRPNTFYFSREGGAKTYQMRFSFADTEQSANELQAGNDLFQSHNQLLKATPAWYTASGVFGDLNVGTSTTADVGFDAHMMRDFYEPSMVEEKQATNFGWRDYGDRLRAGWSNVVNGVRIPGWYNDTHVGATNFFKMYLRTGDQRWYSLAEVSTRHFMDLDVSHAPRQGYWSGFGTPTQPAGEIHAIKHDMVDHSARNVHRGHAHASGLVDYYLLTGDKRSHEVMTEIANWWRFVTPYMFPLPFDFDAPNNQAGYREATRDYGWPLFVMNEYVRMTGDESYHRDVSNHLVTYLTQWWQTRRERIGYNAETNTMTNEPMGLFNDAAQGTGFWTMTRAGNYGDYNNANGCSPWMAGSLIGNIIGFYEHDKTLSAAGKGSGVDYAVLKDMLFQTMNYVVKNGYDADKDWFVYSETIRTYSGGRTHIIYPLAYLDRLYKQELANGDIAHPEWFDTQNMWGPLARQSYDEYMNKIARQYTQSYGWYGYEIIFPLDFFKVMSEAN